LIEKWGSVSWRWLRRLMGFRRVRMKRRTVSQMGSVRRIASQILWLT
jgi:hypothetical protein